MLHNPMAANTRINTQPRKHQRPPTALETHQAHQRSSSFSSFGRSLSRMLPTNRKERGGTMREMHEYDREDPLVGVMKVLDAGLQDVGKRSPVCDIDAGGVDIRKTKSWSPKKSIKMSPEGVCKNVAANAGTAAEIKKVGALRRFWGLRKVTRIGDNELQLGGEREQGEQRKDRDQQATSNNSHENQKTEAQENDDLGVLSVIGRSQLLETKKARRQERRSFRESEDFLGVQGANPKTGYPDPSPITSSDEPSYVSEEMRKKLEDNTRRIEATKREYEAALRRREIEVKRLMEAKEKRRREKKEKAERKRVELKAKMRRHGRWRSDGNGWSMVVGPVLSPIQQSNEGTPRYEIPPGDRLFPMPSAANPNPYPDAQSAFRVMQDYFSNQGTTPKTPKGYVRPYVESAPSTPLPLKYRSPHGESALNMSLPRRSLRQFRDPIPRSPKDQSPYIINTAKGAHPQNRLPLEGSFRQIPSKAIEVAAPLPIHLKAVGSPLQRREASSETIVHNVCTTGPLPAGIGHPSSLIVPQLTLPTPAPGLDVTTLGNAKPTPSLASPTTPRNTFLGIPQDLTDPGGLRGDSVTVTSYPSATTSPAQNPHPSGQSLKDIFHGVRFASLKELPPVVLKDPVAAGIPPGLGSLGLPTSEVQLTRGYLPIRRENHAYTNTPITITTGFAHHAHLRSQLDGNNDMKEAQARISPRPSLRPSPSKIPRASSHVKERPSGSQNTVSQTKAAGTATSLVPNQPVTPTQSALQLLRLCRTVLSEPEKGGQKSTPTSTFMSLRTQSAEQRQKSSLNAAQIAFRYTRPPKLGNAVTARNISLSPPKKREREDEAFLGRRIALQGRGNEDTEDHSYGRKGQGNGALQGEMIEQLRHTKDAARAARKDSLKMTKYDRKTVFSNIECSSPQKKIKAPSKHHSKIELVREVYKIVKELAVTIWWFVTPVFNPRSAFRGRWARQELTWPDVILIGGTGILGIGTFLAGALCAKVLAMALLIMRMLIGIFKTVAGY